MSTACQLFRQRWIDRFAPEGDAVDRVAEGPDEHCDVCQECSTWRRRIELQIGALRTLERLLAPAALEELLARELELVSHELPATQRRAVEALRELSPHRAPAELESLVAAGLTEHAAESPAVRAVRGLAPCQAPTVLDRLVEERLRDPAKAQAEGWVGTLERKSAPASLEASLRAGRLHVLRRRLGASRLGRGLAAAAVLGLAVGAWWLRGDQGRSDAYGPGASLTAGARPFEVVHTDGVTPLDAMTRGLRDLLTPAAAIDEFSEAPVELLPEDLRDRIGRRAPLGSSRADGAASTEPAATQPGGGSLRASGSGAGGAGASGLVPPPFGLIAENPLDSIALRADRQITFFDAFGSLVQFIAYEEEVTTDGRGGFRIEPTRVLTPVLPDAFTFQLLMANRQGFVYRFRDFAVRDAAAFQRNYLVSRRPQGTTLLGRSVSIMDVARRDGSRRYEVWTDDETGLVLNYMVMDGGGSPLVWMKYKSLDLAPDLSGVSFYEPRNEESVLVVGRPLKPQTGGQTPSRPKVLPPGYELLEMATVTDPDTGQLWIKTTYSDGVQPLFFLERVKRRTAGATGSPKRLPRGRAGDRVLVDELGGVASAHARIGSDEFIAVGFVSIAELLDLVQSAL